MVNKKSENFRRSQQESLEGFILTKIWMCVSHHEFTIRHLIVGNKHFLISEVYFCLCQLLCELIILWSTVVLWSYRVLYELNKINEFIFFKISLGHLFETTPWIFCGFLCLTSFAATQSYDCVTIESKEMNFSCFQVLFLNQVI